MLRVSKDNFQKEVLESTTVVVADFWATWCMPCKMMEPILDQIAEEHGENVKIAKVDVDEEPELATQFNIVSIPSLLVFHKGEKVGGHTGVVSQSVLNGMIKDYL